jgi:PBP1b-binding outer membrane lipoprotein LpoB
MKKFLPLAAVLSVFLASCSSGFRDAEIQNVKKDIQSKFESEGFTVTEVSLIRESDFKLTGFVRVEKKILVVPLKLTKNCTVTMDNTSRQTLWECK